MKTIFAFVSVLFFMSLGQAEIVELRQDTVKDSQVEEVPKAAACRTSSNGTSLYRWVVVAKTSNSKIIMDQVCHRPGQNKKTSDIYSFEVADLQLRFPEIMQTEDNLGWCEKSRVCNGRRKCDIQYGFLYNRQTLVLAVNNSSRRVTDSHTRFRQICE